MIKKANQYSLNILETHSSGEERQLKHAAGTRAECQIQKILVKENQLQRVRIQRIQLV